MSIDVTSWWYSGQHAAAAQRTSAIRRNLQAVSSHHHAGCRAGFDEHDGAQDGGGAAQQRGDDHGGKNGDGHRQVLPWLAIIVSWRGDKVIVPASQWDTIAGAADRSGMPVPAFLHFSIVTKL